MSKKIKQSGLVHFYAPFQRVDKDERVVEGYCYTSPKVKGDKWNLKRVALEAAAKAYMAMPCVRSMHGNIAAGVGQGLQWDEKGCLLRAKIVDDQEWSKVVEGVYRGFSIGGRPLISRGNDIESFDWIETSLVDRPCDPGALFTMTRADGVDEAEEYEVEVLDEEVARLDAPNAFIDRNYVPLDFLFAKSGELNFQNRTEVERALGVADVPVRENLEPTVDELVAHIKRHLEGDQAEDARAKFGACLGRVEDTSTESTELLTRVQAAEAEATQVLQRAEAAESELTVVRADLEAKTSDLEVARRDLSAAEEEVQELRKVKLVKPAVVGKAAAVERTFEANNAIQANEGEAEKSALLARRKELMELDPSAMTNAERQENARNVSLVEMKLARMR